jgi:PTH2 family peptidyl-tRNA hydrolase
LANSCKNNKKEEAMIKQVIVMRTTYDGKKLRRGKEIAQACHASIAFLTKRIQNNEPILLSDVEKEWINGIFTKICLKVETEEELLEIERRAKEKGLVCHLITDRGLTEFHGVPTNTCLAIGPDEAEKIDEITKHLELY